MLVGRGKIPGRGVIGAGEGTITAGQGFFMAPHSLSNFEIQKYYQKELTIIFIIFWDFLMFYLLRLFDVLPNFPFTLSKTIPNYYL